MAQRQLGQVTRINNGVLEYAWRPTADTLGDPTSVVWTTVATAPADYVAWNINQSFYGTRRSAGAGQWAVCPICQEEFPIVEMVRVRGRFYCTKNGDAEEMQSDS